MYFCKISTGYPLFFKLEECVLRKSGNSPILPIPSFLVIPVILEDDMNQNSCIGGSLSLCNAFVHQGSILAKVFIATV